MVIWGIPNRNNRWSILRDVGSLRTILSGCVSRFAEINPQFAKETSDEAEQLIHRFFNRVTVNSAEQFVQEQQHAIRRINEKLEETNRQLSRTHKEIKEIGESRLLLLRTVSHDLGNSLNAISTAVTLLEHESEETVQREMLVILHRNIADMRALLQQLLGYSSLIEGRSNPDCQPFDARLLFDDLVSNYRPIAQAKGLSLHAQCDLPLESWLAIA